MKLHVYEGYTKKSPAGHIYSSGALFGTMETVRIYVGFYAAEKGAINRGVVKIEKREVLRDGSSYP
jgi:hypothetical protein